MDLFLFFVGFAILFVLLAIFALGLIYMQCPPKPNLSRSDQEKVFRDPKTDEQLDFASLTDPPSVDLSVIGMIIDSLSGLLFEGIMGGSPVRGDWCSQGQSWIRDLIYP